MKKTTFRQALHVLRGEASVAIPLQHPSAACSAIRGETVSPGFSGNKSISIAFVLLIAEEKLEDSHDQRQS